MKKIFVLTSIVLVLVLSGCNAKSEAKNTEHNTSVNSQRSDSAKAMDSDLLPEGGGKKLPMF